MNKCKLYEKWNPILMIIFLLSPVSISSQIEKIEIFDKNGNSLLFVTFEYDPDGKNTGRSIYTSDSMFLRRTSFINDEAGNRSREVSFNFNDDTTGFTTFSTYNNNPGISVFDQFNLNQFGKPVSYFSNGNNEYNILHNGVLVYKMAYSYTSNGNLNRIDVLSPANSLLYYAVTSSHAGIRGYLGRTNKNKPKITLSGNRCQVSGVIYSEADLKVCMYNIAGQLVSVPLSKRVKPGFFSEHFKAVIPNKSLPGSLFIIRLFINGKSHTSSQKYLSINGRY